MVSISPKIRNTDYWFKVVDFLQQNWAVIEPSDDHCVVYFFDDTSGVFDQIGFDSKENAAQALKRNDFVRYEHDEEAKQDISKPSLPFWWQTHHNGRIYSSGNYWR